jgi:hypothetical protein
MIRHGVCVYFSLTNIRREGETIMRENRRYWLDYDSVSLAILMVGIAVVELLAFSI